MFYFLGCTLLQLLVKEVQLTYQGGENHEETCGKVNIYALDVGYLGKRTICGRYESRHGEHRGHP